MRRESGIDTKNLATINRSVTYQIPHNISIHSTCSKYESSASAEQRKRQWKTRARRGKEQSLWWPSSCLRSMIIKQAALPKEAISIIAEPSSPRAVKNCAACARTRSAKWQGSMDWRSSRPRFPVSNTGIMGMSLHFRVIICFKSAIGPWPRPCSGGH